MIKGLQTQIEAIQNQSAEDCKQLWEQLETIAKTPINAAQMQTKPQPSFTNIANSQSGPLGPVVPPTWANTLFCTIDMSRVGEEDKAKAQIANVRQMIEKEMQGKEGMGTWRCAAVIKDPKNDNQVKIICRQEEIQCVKEAAQKLNVPGWRVL
ncbi:hypothetical protein TSTA_094470 [Talaromyces stipitatus ATCC 10500]|uniref:Uncharacterized protein n=1 Tax=Talaromyces stipitatus (strain ATCC 10500 / CBS 375.48 / QM 6759 / NRRL 1006) TaxID=441959 RepID=B8M2U6_TALSN|nr:uncharacterized protein TSTA_094470 [Talaromyces stipitatus ATCC 10500]EED22201.1 hypothetical protein TSTA_094470 [Talaromyces stipitatus ATCC 10500]